MFKQINVGNVKINAIYTSECLKALYVHILAFTLMIE